MPKIIPSSDLRNKYNNISKMCHESNSPVYITKNGSGDLALMSIEAYENITDKIELLLELEKGMNDVRNGNLISMEDVVRYIAKKMENGEL